MEPPDFQVSYQALYDNMTVFLYLSYLKAEIILCSFVIILTWYLVIYKY